jgi:hypothetical protein
MRAALTLAAVFAVTPMPLAAQLPPVENPAAVRLPIGRKPIALAAGESRADLEVGTEPVIDVAAEPLICEAAAPTDCPSPPEITGFADTTLPWNAQQLHGRVLIVRNTGTGILLLKAEGAGSLQQWRLGDNQLLRPGQAAVFSYDAARARWRALGTRAPGVTSRPNEPSR